MSKAKPEKEQDFQEVADEYGKGVVAGMREELDALKHAQECDGETDCDKCGSGDSECGFCGGYQVKCEAGKDAENPDAWHDEEAARMGILESPLSFEVRSDWASPGEPMKAEEYRLLLGTGGPASRIIGELDEYGTPTTAHFEYQDWFKPWTEATLTVEECATLLEWAQNFEVC